MSATKIQKFKLRERMENEAATMPGLVDLWAARTPDADGARFPGGVSSYAELSASPRRSAAALHGAGVGFGDRVGVLLLEGSERYLSLVLGAGRLGAIPVPLNARFKTRELGYVMRHAGLQAALHGSVVRGPGGRGRTRRRTAPSCSAEEDAAFWDAAVEPPRRRRAPAGPAG